MTTLINMLAGIIIGLAGHQLEKPTHTIFGEGEIRTLASYSEGGVLVILHFAFCVLRRKVVHKEHAVADLMLSFLWVGMGTVLAFMLDALKGER